MRSAGGEGQSMGEGLQDTISDCKISNLSVARSMRKKIISEENIGHVKYPKTKYSKYIGNINISYKI